MTPMQESIAMHKGATAERVHLIGWLKVCGMPGAKEIADALERDVDHLFRNRQR